VAPALPLDEELAPARVVGIRALLEHAIHLVDVILRFALLLGALRIRLVPVVRHHEAAITRHHGLHRLDRSRVPGRR